MSSKRGACLPAREQPAVLGMHGNLPRWLTDAHLANTGCVSVAGARPRIRVGTSTRARVIGLDRELARARCGAAGDPVRARRRSAGRCRAELDRGRRSHPAVGRVKSGACGGCGGLLEEVLKSARRDDLQDPAGAIARVSDSGTSEWPGRRTYFAGRRPSGPRRRLPLIYGNW
jgi:hypothetical protein